MSSASSPQPSRKDLLLFGLVLPILFAVVGWVVLRRAGSQQAANAIWLSGGAVSLLYLCIPRIRRPIFVGYYHLTRPIGWAISTLLLLSIFILLVTPIGLLRRAFSGDALSRKLDPAQPTYWHPRENGRPMTDYFRQF